MPHHTTAHTPSSPARPAAASNLNRARAYRACPSRCHAPSFPRCSPSASVATSLRGACPGPCLPLPDPARACPRSPLAIGCLPYCPLCQ
ncbi:hypothetical protein COCC4DRAFT_60814 [Bipolaris maydis ATCC 48331]|uniref:Uncharacterized protein n=2 Tax=Cochliobolus heterostrophus TaxID=5016 RepID=M2U6E8_COCH5|nr:uncharacterized protein COCC4DRAFT_60814 [Bipolaris maydis ATCC 48331]EMD89306.1 hypothetical protein COCHEDRAFT_1108450 [Bipolaris maydis C5]ENI04977.1 hypothetical protein COCC4DRAFT_60814 [Bipolaris maydis ATCC 48331]